jgi:hypothetical protein
MGRRTVDARPGFHCLNSIFSVKAVISDDMRKFGDGLWLADASHRVDRQANARAGYGPRFRRTGAFAVQSG